MQKSRILKNKILIVGCTRLGASIANKFSSNGKNTMVIDQDENSFYLLSDRFSGYTFVGDVCDLSVLEEAYITSAKEVIVTTGNDNINLFVSLVAKKLYSVPNVCTVLDDPSNEVLLKGTNVKVISPLELSFDKFNLIREGKR